MSNAKLLKSAHETTIQLLKIPVLPQQFFLNVEGHDDDDNSDNDNDNDNGESAMRAGRSFVYRVTAGASLYELA